VTVVAVVEGIIVLVVVEVAVVVKLLLAKVKSFINLTSLPL